ncbi:MAG TPA: DUF1232 domain-containing protein [Thermoanaerobaculia bacterium]|nr:DUF1232 domain-containing protein [Thermoanaerobaculia bacterium]
MSATTITTTHETASGSSQTTDEKRAQRFYDRLRERIHSYAEARGRVAERSTDYLLLVPDMFILLWRLVNDPRVTGSNKVLLGSGVAYYFFPLDIVPELFLGPIGFLDDLVFGVYMLNKILMDTDAEIVREHWSGHEDILQSIQRVLNAADNLVATDALAKIKSMVGWK